MQPQTESASAGIELTSKGERYTHEREISDLRRAVESLVEGLIDLLDDIDGDPDSEDHPHVDGGDDDRSDFEPSLGWTDLEARFSRYADPDVPDGEDEHDGRESGLGWTAHEAAFGRYSLLSRRGLEDNHDDEDAEGGSYGVADHGGMD